MFTGIIHIADIHIRKGDDIQSRYDEYARVMEKTVKKCAKLALKYRLIAVICGDVFHDKLQISPPGIRLFLEFITQLGEIMPVAIIQGNHDMFQEHDDKNNDMIEALMRECKLPNIHYLKDTGLYDFDNLEFGVLSIRDIRKRGAGSGLVDELPIFPEPRRHDAVKVALCHCTITKCQLTSTRNSTDGVPLEMFKNYDVALLGDVHRRQVGYSKKYNVVYAYPGSLVQQNFGEALEGHGFLLWELPSGKWDVMNEPISYNISNVTGYLQLQVHNDTVFSNHQLSGWCMFDPTISYPRHLNVRIVAKNTSHPALYSCLEHLREAGSTLQISTRKPMGNHELNDEDNRLSLDMRCIDKRSIVCDCLIESLGEATRCGENGWEHILLDSDGFVLDTHNLPHALLSVVEAKNNLIIKSRAALDDGISTSTQRQFRISDLFVDWILPFGHGNHFRFEGGVLRLINAPNGYGKSAIFECVCLALFGESFPSRSPTSALNTSIINKRRPPGGEPGRLRINFELDGIMYSLERKYFERAEANDPSAMRLREKNVVLEEAGRCIRTGAGAVKRWVSDAIGPMSHFLLFTMISQNLDYDLLRCKPKQQMEILDGVFDIDYFNQLCEHVRLVRRCYKDVDAHVLTHSSASEPVPPHGDDLSTLERRHMDISKELEKNEGIYHRIAVATDELELSVPDQTGEQIKSIETIDVSDICDLVARSRELSFSIRRLKRIGAEPCALSGDVPDLPRDLTVRGDECRMEYVVDFSQLEACIGEYNDNKRKTDDITLRIERLNSECPEYVGRQLSEYDDLVSTVDILAAQIPKQIPEAVAKPIFTSKQLSDMEIALREYHDLLNSTTEEQAIERLREVRFEKEKITSELKLFPFGIENCDFNDNDENSELEKLLKRYDRYEHQRIAYKRLLLLAQEVGPVTGCDGCGRLSEAVEYMSSDIDKLQKRVTNTKAALLSKCNHLDLARVTRIANAERQQMKKRRDELEKLQEQLCAEERKLELLPEMRLLHTQLLEANAQTERWKLYTKHKTVVDNLAEARMQLTWWTSAKQLSARNYENNRKEHTLLVTDRCTMDKRCEHLSNIIVNTWVHWKRCRNLTVLEENNADIHKSLSVYVAERNRLYTKMTEMRVLEREIYLQIAAWKQYNNDLQKFRDVDNGLNQLRNSISLKRNIADAAEPLLRGLKTWLYKSRLLPAAIHEANYVLASIFDHRGFELQYDFRDDVVHWSVMDDGNKITLEKLSGAQFFAVGLSIRLALSVIGANRLRCSQLFIDEGFCSFDRDNLMRVPELLHGLRDMFEEITIVSHLDDIKACADEVIPIKRKDGISYINRK